ncbi:MAG: hypothetical protein FD168_204 [Desulfobulbaceae bacterium]|nr:MAG: hypothetical protein FD168_204 [Desulfobulbaceae bacterium]
MNDLKITSSDLPGLYQSADQASLDAQCIYFKSLKWYLILLVLAALIAFMWPNDAFGALSSASLFLVTLGILIFIRVQRPDDTWYNGRAVAESVKTRAWRWMMCAEPYEDTENIKIVSGQFINDLRAILSQNRSLSHFLQPAVGIKDPISDKMTLVRSLSVLERLGIYAEQRIQNQANFYSIKSQFNKRRARQWFWVSVVLHALAILTLLYRIKDPMISLPVEVIATAAGAVLTWLQAKKHNELNSAYALTAHEIVLIRGEALSIKNEKQLSEFIVDSEAAFSREHTQWVARKGD